jgi:hypothetical protein
VPGFSLLGVEHVQDGSGQQGMRRLLPVVAPLLGTFRVHQDVGDVLHVPNLVRALAHLEQRVEPGGQRVGGIEQEAMREPGAPICCQHPILALDVMHDRRARPRQKRGQHEADAFGRARRRDHEDVLGAVMPQVSVAMQTEDDALLSR